MGRKILISSELPPTNHELRLIDLRPTNMSFMYKKSDTEEIQYRFTIKLLFISYLSTITVPVRPLIPSEAFSNEVIRDFLPAFEAANLTAASTFGSIDPGAK